MKFLLVLSGLLALALASGVTHRGSRTATNPPAGWDLGNRAPAHHPMRLLIGLKQRNLDKLESLFWAVATPGNKEYRNFRSIQEITKMIAPAAEHVERVVAWLASHGVKRSEVELLGDAIVVHTTVAVAESLAHTTLHEWTHVKSRKTVVRVVGTWGLDAKVSPMIDLIEGLTEFPVPRYSVKKNVKKFTPMGADLNVAVCPQTVTTMYSVPDGTKNTGNSSVCVAEWEDEYFSPAQLQKFATEFAVTIPPLTKDHIVGKNDASNPGDESTLDIQYAAALAQGVDTWFWSEGNNVWQWTWAVEVFNATSAPLMISISYGWSEANQCEKGIGGDECQKLGINSKQYVTRVNTEYQKLGLRGISLIVSSGDSGANGRSDPDCTEKRLEPDFPAASPFITSVGATQIMKGVAKLPNPPPGCKGQNCASAGTEVAVSYDVAQFTSGGGFSWIALQPLYQTNAVKAYLSSGVTLPPSSYFNTKGRGYPDVSAFGNNVLIEEGGIQGVGGTSCSAPIFAGLMSMLNGDVMAKTGKPLGFLNPLLYSMAAAQPSTFTDVTVGDNRCTEQGCAKSCQGFNAARGWDPVTGLGTPVFSEIQKYVQNVIMNNDA